MAKSKQSKDSGPPQAWIDGPNQYKLGLQGGKVVCLNPKGTQLASIPNSIKEDPIVEQVQALSSWLDEHQIECLHTVERWMLRSLVIPRGVLSKLWPDPAWRTALENLVIAPAQPDGRIDYDAYGLLRDPRDDKGIGVIDPDGETLWFKSPCIAFLHPILIGDLEGIRELANDLGIQQTIEQLFRPVFKPSREQLEQSVIRDYQNGEFEQLNFALGVCKRLGYPVRGGYATCRVWEGDSPKEARYFLGDNAPDSPTFTGELIFVDNQQNAVPISQVGLVTFSEGIRMASFIFSKRKVEKAQGVES